MVEAGVGLSSTWGESGRCGRGDGGVFLSISTLDGVAWVFLGVWGGGISGSVGDALSGGGWGGVVVSGGLTIGGRWAMSSRIDLFLAGWCAGVYFLRNLLFLRVCLPDPSILMRYW